MGVREYARAQNHILILDDLKAIYSIVLCINTRDCMCESNHNHAFTVSCTPTDLSLHSLQLVLHQKECCSYLVHYGAQAAFCHTFSLYIAKHKKYGQI